MSVRPYQCDAIEFSQEFLDGAMATHQYISGEGQATELLYLPLPNSLHDDNETRAEGDSLGHDMIMDLEPSTLESKSTWFLVLLTIGLGG